MNEIERLQAELKKAYGRITALSLKEGRIKIADMYQQQQAIIDKLQVENNKMTDMLMAAGFLGQGTQLIGDKRYKELVKAETELKNKEKEIERQREYLRKYGGHLDFCGVRWSIERPEVEPCDCGLEKALKGRDGH